MKVKDDAVYCFGGMNANRESTAIFKQLKIRKEVMKWEVLNTKGKAPHKRYNHSMNFQE